MYGLTQKEAASERDKLMKGFNPRNPEHVGKLKSLTQQASGGNYTIATEGELAGKGLGFFGEPGTGKNAGLPGGFTIMETERKRLERDPNSAEFKKQNAMRRQKGIDDRMKLQGGMFKRK